MDDFVHAPKSVNVKRLQREEAAQQMEAPERGRAIRLYSASAGEVWALQVRGPIGTGFAAVKDGKDYAIASAYMTRDDLILLRNAISAALKDTAR